MLNWDGFIKLLGCSRVDSEFAFFINHFNEPPEIEEGVLGDRIYYSFFRSGVLFLLEDEIVEQITFYAKPDEGFSDYKGALPVSIITSEHDSIQILGNPSASGGGKMDGLMGYVDRWIKYEKEGYTLHLQFSQNDNLSRVSIMK